MRREQLMNNAATTLTVGVDGAATVLSVASTSVLPTAGDFRLLVEKELVLCTAVTGNTLTVVRGIEGTTATSHASSAAVVHVLTQAGVQAFLRDNIPLVDTQPPLRLTDSDGNPLTASSFTVIKSGSTPCIKQLGPTITVNRRGTNGSNYATWLTRPLPSPFPYVVTACVGGMGVSGAANLNAGLGLCNSTTGVGVALLYSPITSQLTVQQFSAVGTASAATWGNTNWGSTPIVSFLPRMWLRLCCNGVTAVFSVSSNGLTWVPIQYQILSSLFGSSLPDKIGFLAQSASAQGSTANLFAWDEGANLTETGLISWYKCNENPAQGLIADYGPASLHMQDDGTYTNGQQTSPAALTDVPRSPFTSSLSFDGSAGCFNASNAGAGDFGMWAIGGVDRTYAMWFKSTNGGNLLGHGEVTNSAQFVVQLNSGGFSIDMGWASANTVSPSSWPTPYSTWPDGNWHHVAVVCLSGTVTFYVDGVLVPTAMSQYINTQPGCICFSRRATGATDQNYVGQVCDIRVYKRALSQTEAANLYSGLNADGTTIVL